MEIVTLTAAGIGFARQLLAFARAMRLDRVTAEDQSRKILKTFRETNISIEELKQDITAESDKIKSMVTTAVVVEVQSRLQDIKKIPSHELDLLIRLLYCLKDKAPNVVFTVFIKYKIGTRLSTLGFAGTSSDCIEDIVKRVEKFLRGLSHVKGPPTAYTGVKIRGKYDSDIESFCTSALTTIITDVCHLSRHINLEDKTKCDITARGKETIVMLETNDYEEHREDFDELRRVFLVGDTRSGKSTLGNTLLNQDTFKTSKGITGTMRIHRSELVENIKLKKWVTEIYDTPGLNDKDGLDIMYESDIKDYVCILQRVSSFILTVAVDGGITGSLQGSLESYKSLFGSSMASMMIVVLTINESADKEKLSSSLELNMVTVLGLDETILEDNVYCVSLHDLREKKESASHDTVKTIRSHCRSMPMKIIEAFAQKYQKIHDALLLKSDDLEKEVQKITDDGWQSYDNLTKMYEQSPFIKMTKERVAGLNGFVMKNPNKKNIGLAVATLGVVNCVRKVAIHVWPRGNAEQKVWDNFFNKNESNRKDSCLLRNFGNLLHGEKMGVIVKDLPVYYVGTLRVKRYQVMIFHPEKHTYKNLATFVKELIEEEGHGLKKETIEQLLNTALPSSIKSEEKKAFVQDLTQEEGQEQKRDALDKHLDSGLPASIQSEQGEA